mmetsp:Transcript_123472/g.394925  ORF Transcript_123472/g.394925 Transcript_123472/m.394925 type:complete len:81 (-) Transcript_123472:184-426(-)
MSACLRSLETGVHSRAAVRASPDAAQQAAVVAQQVVGQNTGEGDVREMVRVMKSWRRSGFCRAKSRSFRPLRERRQLGPP